MLAVDTNLIVRLVINDDPQQVERAVKVFQSRAIFIPKSVLLETEWVLRYSYSLDRATIERSIHNIIRLPNVTVEDEGQVSCALSWYADGIDFADALHLASSAGARRFMTFDEKFVKRSKRLTSPEVYLA